MQGKRSTYFEGQAVLEEGDTSFPGLSLAPCKQSEKRARHTLTRVRDMLLPC